MPKSKKKNLLIPFEREESFAQAAFRLGYLKGDRNPNYSDLFRAIGEAKAIIDRPLILEEQDQLRQLFILASEVGKLPEIELLGRYFLERPDLSEAVRADIKELIGKSTFPWLDLLSNFISKQQSFQLSYRNAANKDEQHTCTYAHLEQIERHRYLVARVTEPAENPEHPNLAYNRCFRIDRILAIWEAQDLEWQELGLVKVVFHLYGNWTKSYEPKKGDLDPLLPTWIVPPGGSEEPVREIKRQFWSFFWLLRELERYPKVQIISPEEARIKHLQILQKKLSCYWFDGV